MNISLVGIGKLGLNTALCLEKKGYNVLGFDIRVDHINNLNNKTFSTQEPELDYMLKTSKNFKATSDLDKLLLFSKIIYIMIDTPSKKNEYGYIHDNLNNFFVEVEKKKLINYHFIVGCSVNPGYFSDELPNFFDFSKNTISYNPQFVPLGDLVNKFLNPDMILIGQSNEQSGLELEKIYKNVCENNPKIMRMTLQSAEIVKFAVASFVTSKISFANFIGDIADKTDNANKYDILNAVGNDSRIGHKCLYPGWGYGGPCFPRDNSVLIKYSKKLGIPTMICEATHNYNNYHAIFLAEQMKQKNLSEYIFTNVSFKENCPIPFIQDSHKLKVAKILALDGNKVIIKDKLSVIEKVKKDFGDIFCYSILD